SAAAPALADECFPDDWLPAGYSPDDYYSVPADSAVVDSAPGGWPPGDCSAAVDWVEDGSAPAGCPGARLADDPSALVAPADLARVDYFPDACSPDVCSARVDSESADLVVGGWAVAVYAVGWLDFDLAA